MSEDKKKNPNRRYVGKVKTQKGQYGDFQKILVDNPKPNKEDGSANEYYRGSLVWLDAATGKKYLVKQLSVRGAPESSRAKGFLSSISIDLDSSYEVEELG
jgi:hypothetical protein